MAAATAPGGVSGDHLGHRDGRRGHPWPRVCSGVFPALVTGAFGVSLLSVNNSVCALRTAPFPAAQSRFPACGWRSPSLGQRLPRRMFKSLRRGHFTAFSFNAGSALGLQLRRVCLTQGQKDFSPVVFCGGRSFVALGRRETRGGRVWVQAGRPPHPAPQAADLPRTGSPVPPVLTAAAPHRVPKPSSRPVAVARAACCVGLPAATCEFRNPLADVRFGDGAGIPAQVPPPPPDRLTARRARVFPVPRLATCSLSPRVSRQRLVASRVLFSTPLVLFTPKFHIFMLF